MKTWNIQLVGRDGHPPVPLLMLRYILAWPLVLAAPPGLAGGALHGLAVHGHVHRRRPFMIFIWTWIDRDGQFLHDRILGTRAATRARAKPGRPGNSAATAVK